MNKIIILALALLLSGHINSQEVPVFKDDSEVELAQSHAVLKATNGRVYSVSFSPDDKLLASAGQDGTVRIWDLDKKQEALVLGPFSGSIYSISFSPEGNSLAFCGEDGIVMLYDFDKKRAVPLPAPKSDLYCLAFSPDSKLLAYAGKEGKAVVWDLAIMREKSTFNQQSAVYAITFIDENTISLAGEAGSLILYNLKDSTSTKITAEEATIKSMTSHKDNIIFCTLTGKLKIVDRKQKRVILDKEASKEALYTICASKDLIATAGVDNVITLWDFNGNLIAELKGHTQTVRAVSVSHSGDMLASASEDGCIKVWDVRSRSELFTLKGHTGTVYTISFSTDSKSLISGSSDGKVRLFDIESLRQIAIYDANIKGTERDIHQVAFNGKFIAAARFDKLVDLLDASDLKRLADLQGHNETVYSVGFSPDRSYLASGGQDGLIYLWDLQTKKMIAELWGHSGGVYSVKFSPDSKKLLSGGHSGNIRLHNLEDQKELLCKKAHKRNVRDICFSPSGKIFVTSSWKEIKLWDAQNFTELMKLKGHEDYVNSISFSPDGIFLASGGWDDYIKIWNIKTGAQVQSIKVNAKAVWSVSFSPDGKLLASGNGDGTVRLWRILDRFYIGDQLIDWSAGNREGHSEIKVTFSDFELVAGQSSKINIDVENTGNHDVFRLIAQVNMPGFSKTIYLGKIKPRGKIHRSATIDYPHNLRGQDVKLSINFYDATESNLSSRQFDIKIK